MAKKTKVKIKTRKERELEYEKLYGDVSTDTLTRLQDHLGDDFTPDLVSDAIQRVKDLEKNMTYSMIRFTFHEIPVQTHRARVNFRTKSMRTPNAAENMAAIANLVSDIKQQMTLIATPMKVILEAYHPMPKCKPIEILLFETKKIPAVGKPDFDNELKAYCDMIQKTIILDDDLVSSSIYNKYFSLKPRAVLSIVYMDDYASEHTFKKIKSRKGYKDQAHRITAELLIPLPTKKKKRR